jgi:hypothetical protein
VFRADLDLDLTAAALMAQIKGLGLQRLGGVHLADFDLLVSEIAAQIEQWLESSN